MHNLTTEKEAIACIETTNYNYVETIMCNEASNIKIAQYYSCTKDRGYLIVKTDRKTYLHTDVPYGVWIDLKEAKSTSGYYNFYLKNRFKFNGEPSQSPVL